MLFMAGVAGRAKAAFQGFVSRVSGSRFGYDAADHAGNGKRRAPSRDLRHEDGVLKGAKRTAVQSSARDSTRSFSIAAWVVRAHVNYVTRHRFQADVSRGLSAADAMRLETDEAFKAQIDAFDEQLESLVAKLSEADRCDISGRYCLSELVSLTERAAFVDGDMLWVKLASGHVQAIESDLVRDRTGDRPNDDTQTINGVEVDDNRGGRPKRYAVHYRPNKGQNGYEFDRYVSAANAWLHGYFDRVDQVRGISPLAAALNPLRDVYEGIDLSLVKLKAESLFALKIKSSAIEGTGTLRPASNSTDDEEEQSDGQKYQVDFGSGPVKLELDPDDDAEFMQSNSPGANCQEFLKLVIAVVLKAADMPYSFYDESFTNFYGSRAAWLRYDESCLPKRERVRRLLNKWTLWRLQLAVMDGELVLPEGMQLTSDLWEWIPEGSTWWDPVKDVEGDKSAVQAGFVDAESVTRKRAGGNIWKNIEKMGRLLKHAAKHGVTLSWAPIPQAAPDPTDAEKNAQPANKELSA